MLTLAFFLICSVLFALLYLGEQYCCHLAEPAGLRQKESPVYFQIQEQAGYWEIQVPQEKAGIHSRGGECEEAPTHHPCTTCPVASAQWPDCSRLIETIFVRLCGIHRSPKKKGTGTVSGPYPGGLSKNQAVQSG